MNLCRRLEVPTFEAMLLRISGDQRAESFFHIIIYNRFNFRRISTRRMCFISCICRLAYETDLNAKRNFVNSDIVLARTVKL
jgi:hypothetical protein